jgi:hypothetical protein
MVARAAQNNLSVFSSKMEPILAVHKEYVKVAIRYGNSLSNSKYFLIQSLASIAGKSEEIKCLLRRVYVCKSYEELFECYGMTMAAGSSGSRDETDVAHAEDIEPGYTAAQQDARLYTTHILPLEHHHH